MYIFKGSNTSYDNFSTSQNLKLPMLGTRRLNIQQIRITVLEVTIKNIILKTHLNVYCTFPTSDPIGILIKLETHHDDSKVIRTSFGSLFKCQTQLVLSDLISEVIEEKDINFRQGPRKGECTGCTGTP